MRIKPKKRLKRNKPEPLAVTEKSTGTLSNVIKLLTRKKNSVVFINKSKEFVIIKSPNDLDRLIQCMSAADYAKAEDKIKMSEKLDQLKNQQMNMFI